MSDLTPTPSPLFFTKNDIHDPRLGDLVKTQELGAEVVLLGYPDDEGVRNNGGRPGASTGPDEIRHWLYRMTPHPRRTLKSFVDLGNLNIKGPLETRHAKAQGLVHGALTRGCQALSLGGGNDYAYPDGLAFLRQFSDQQPLVINVDAHLDVRDLKQGITSGTPFFRLLESEFKFQFVELGIQTQCNSKAHFDYVENKGGQILTLEELADSGLSFKDAVTQQLGDTLLKKRPTFLAIDIDAFSFPYAMGSSAAWPLGIEPHAFWPLLQMFLTRLNVRVLGIYETAPPLDPGQGTSRLAAQWAHLFLHHV